MASIQTDWQLDCLELNQRGAYFLRTGQWSDCSFLVGPELKQVVVFGHKVVLAIASSVFDAMFKRCMTTINEPIPIVDIQIDTFRALLQYIYTGKLFMNSFNEVLHLYCAAQKYLLLHLVEACTEYLLFNMNPSNVCRTYKFARMYEHNDLIKGCIKVISLKIKEVLNDSSFEELDLETVISVFSLDFLNVESELDLFKAAVRYAKAMETRNIKDTSLSTEEPFVIETLQKSAVLSLETEQNVECSNLKVVNIDSSAESSAEAVTQTCRSGESQTTAQITPKKTDKPEDKGEPCIRTLVEKIRFLTLSPEEFGAGPANSLLLSESEAFAVLMNIVNPQTDLPLPPGFSTSRIARIETIERNSHIMPISTSVPSSRVSVEGVHARPSPNEDDKSKESVSRCRRSGKIYCRRALLRPSGVFYTGVRDCSVTFTVDKKICLLGIQMARPGRKTDSDGIEVECCAELLDANGVRLVQAAFSQSDNGASLKDILFERRLYIRGNKVYRVAVKFEKELWYPMMSRAPQVKEHGVSFDFAIGESCYSVRDGIVCSILFTH